MSENSVIEMLRKKLEKEIEKNKGYRKKIKKLEKENRTDGLTGLDNQAEFNRVLNTETKRANRYKHPLVLLFIDLNEFSEINNQLGHVFGDLVLKEIAALMLKVTRSTDILCRAGGDEFAILLPETKPMDVVVVIQRLCEEVDSLIEELKIPESIGFGISIGGTEYQTGMKISKFVKLADDSMYISKNEIKNN